MIYLIKKYANYLKIAVSITIIWIIFSRIDAHTALSTITQLRLLPVILLLLLSAIKLCSQVFHWKYCLEINKDFNFSYLANLRTHLIGLSLRLVMPGGYATFGKVIYVAPDRKKETFYSIVIEKFFLTWTVLFFASWSFIVFYQKWAISYVLIAIFISLLPFILPLLMRRYVSREILENYYRSVFFIIMTQLLYTIMTFIQYYILLSAFSEHSLSFMSVSLIISMILLANIIPITYSGLGLREAASALLLPTIGIPVEIAVGTSLIIFLINAVIPALPGIYFIAKR